MAFGGLRALTGLVMADRGRRGVLIVALCLLWLAMLSSTADAQLAGKAEAAPPPYRIAVFVSSNTERCYDTGDAAAVTALAKAEQTRINEAGGVAGRAIQIRIYDDVRDNDRAVANVRAALEDPDTLAMVGLVGSNRAKAVFDVLGKDIGARRIPFLSGISVNQIFAPYPNVFTTQPTQDDERVPVMAAFIRSLGFSRPAFLGSQTVFSRALGEGLKREMRETPLVVDEQLGGNNGALNPDDVARGLAQLKDQSPDVIVLGFGGERAGVILSELTKSGVAPAVIVAGRLENIPADVTTSYPNALYELAWDRLPEADSDRLRSMMSKDPPQQWMFEGTKISAAPGWVSGKCELRENLLAPDPYNSANMRAVGVGSIAADMIALVAHLAGQERVGTDLATLRRRVVERITTQYAAGRGAFKGRFDNWSFNPATRAATRTPFVVILPHGLGRTQLAPVQFLRTRSGSLRKVETIYLDIDLVRAHHVEDNEKTFFAEFYLSMRNGTASTIETIDFMNAYVDPRTNGRQVAIELLHNGGASDVYPSDMKVYKVAGRFAFEPDLSSYPFDTQRFSIDIQPKRGDAPFIIQPPPPSLRDKNVLTDGWQQKAQFVGYDEDFIPLMDAYTHEPSVVPFYKASFVWLMKRETTDYYLRVVVPLAFILVVAYFSIFIPIAHFEAIVTIQVTALLSAVALYLSLPKLDSDTATVSDRIFVFNYMMVSLMIVITILRITRVVTKRPWLNLVLWVVHVIALPIVVAGVSWLVYMVSEVGIGGVAAQWDAGIAAIKALVVGRLWS
ncbi:MAG: ABC transporter substrate-binding protein [Hyphomicrobiaceae bacterium]